MAEPPAYGIVIEVPDENDFMGAQWVDVRGSGCPENVQGHSRNKIFGESMGLVRVALSSIYNLVAAQISESQYSGRISEKADIFPPVPEKKSTPRSIETVPP